MRSPSLSFILFLLLINCSESFSQDFTLSCAVTALDNSPYNCDGISNDHFILTDSVMQVGEAAYSSLWDLEKGFNLDLCIYLGGQDMVGDGLTIIFRNGAAEGAVIIDSCEDFNYISSVDTAFAFRLETPTTGEFDRLSFIKIENGNTTVLSTVQANPNLTNIEDGELHSFNLIWDPDAEIFSVFIDDYFRLSSCNDSTDFLGNSIWMSAVASTMEQDTQVVGIKSIVFECCTPATDCVNETFGNGLWRQEGYRNSSAWYLDNTTQITQTESEGISSFSTTYPLQNTEINFTLNTSENADGFIGFSFGEENFQCEEDEFNSFLFDWKGEGNAPIGCNLTVASTGTHLIKINTNNLTEGCNADELFLEHNGGGLTILQENPNASAWAVNTEYHISIRYTNSELVIVANNENLSDTLLQYCTEEDLPAGNFGFYTAYQAGISFSDFSFSPVADFHIEADTICQDIGMSIEILPSNCIPNNFNGIDSIKVIFAHESFPPDTIVMEIDSFLNTLSYTFNHTGNYQIELVSFNAFGCNNNSEIKEVFVLPFSTPVLTHESDTVLCDEGAVFFDVNVGSQDGIYQWSNGATTSYQIIDTAGLHWVEVGAGECSDRDSVYISFYLPMIFELDIIESCYQQDNGRFDMSMPAGSYTLILNGQDTISLPLENLSPDDYEIEVYNAGNCQETVNFIISETPEVFTEISITNISCHNENDGMLIVENASNNLAYSIDGDNFFIDTIFTDLAMGTYDFWVEEVNGCRYFQHTFFVNEPELFEINLPESDTIYYGDSLRLKADFTGDFSTLNYQWAGDSMSCLNCPTPTVSPLSTSNYSLTITTESGCFGSAIQNVTVLRKQGIYIPNAFSPNGDGNNDEFRVFAAAGLQNISSFSIYTKYGDLIFQKKNFLPDSVVFDWDGTHRGQDLPQGIYVYLIEIEWIDGKTDFFKGDVTLIR